MRKGVEKRGVKNRRSPLRHPHLAGANQAEKTEVREGKIVQKKVFLYLLLSLFLASEKECFHHMCVCVHVCHPFPYLVQTCRRELASED